METSDFLSEYFLTAFAEFSSTLKGIRTRKDYLSYCRQMCSFAKKDFFLLTPQDASAWLNSLIASGKFKPGTIATKISALTSVSSFLLEKGLITYNVFEGLYVERPDTYLKLSDIPSLKELDALLEAAKDNDVLFAILSLIIRVGLTASEAVRIRCDDLALFDNGIAQLTIHKGKYARTVMIPSDVVEILATRLKGGDYIFYNQYGNPLKLHNLQAILKKTEVAAGMKRFWTLQDIRHAALLFMLKGGASQEEVAVHAGVDGRWMFRYNKVMEEYPVVLADYQFIRLKEK